MPRITVSLSINANGDKVFNVMKNVGKFPEYMKFVKFIKIKEKHASRVVSEWTIDIDGTPIEWTQEDNIHLAAKEISFKAIKGDYGYEGSWKVVDELDGHTNVILQAVFDWGAPRFEQLFGKVYERKARLALMGMLKAIKRVSENG